MKHVNKLPFLGAALAVSALFAGSTSAHATPIAYPPYGSIGTIITAATPIISTGSSAITFAGFSAADLDYVNVIDVTTHTQSGFVFDNQTAVPGSQVLIVANAGDLLVVELYNVTTGSYFYSGTGVAPSGTISCIGAVTSPIACASSEATSQDGKDHAYLTSFSAGTIGATTLGPGTFVGMEDLAASQSSDFDYNDDQFLLTGVTAGTIPEPSGLILLGTGLLGGAVLLHRKRRIV